MYIIDYIKEVFEESSIREICNRHLKTSLSTATSNQNIGVNLLREFKFRTSDAKISVLL